MSATWGKDPGMCMHIKVVASNLEQLAMESGFYTL